MNRQKGNTVLWLVIIIIIAVGAFFFLRKDANAPAPDDVSNDDTTSAVPADPNNPVSEKEIVVTYTNDGFSPKEVLISLGDTIRFVNQSTLNMWPASALHPTHTVYPNSDIQKCGTSDAGEIFDACNNLSEGESWTFTFNESGEWGYHNHSRAQHFGKIIVR